MCCLTGLISVSRCDLPGCLRIPCAWRGFPRHPLWVLSAGFRRSTPLRLRFKTRKRVCDCAVADDVLDGFNLQHSSQLFISLIHLLVLDTQEVHRTHFFVPFGLPARRRIECVVICSAYAGRVSIT
jgi:hypothetical protein